jgi:GT2 family glycosyltransferase
MPYSYSIVIPAYNNWSLTHQILLDIFKMLPQDVEVVVADDCSTQWEVKSGLEWWKNHMLHERLKVVRPEENLGFLRNANNGVKEASGDVVILCNNDIRIYENPIPKIEIILEEYPVPTLMGKSMQRGDTGWNRFGNLIFPYLEGWFLAFLKSDWNNFGGFDERYIPFDFDDVDLSTTFIHNGGTLIELDVNVSHIGGQSIGYSIERQRQTKINQNKFEEKWIKYD